VSHNLLNTFSPGGAAIDISAAQFTTGGKFGVYCTVATGNIRVTTLEGDDLVVPASVGVLPWVVRAVRTAADGTTVANGNLFSIRV
jgi:hypothetical protein